MNAVATAERVLRWAACAGFDAGFETGGVPQWPPPSGGLGGAAELARPGRAAGELVGELARRCAARLGAGVPPFGDRSRVGPGALLLACAVGAREHREPAAALVRAAPPSSATAPVSAVRRGAAVHWGWADAVARHGVVRPVVARAGETAEAGGAGGAGAPREVRELGVLLEALLHASPLTALLYRPALQRLAAGAIGAEVRAAADLLRRPRGGRVLAAGLAAWRPDPLVLTWRSELLARLVADASGEGASAALDAYAAARVAHGAEWDDRIKRAEGALAESGAAVAVVAGGPDTLRLPAATIRFWVPLADLAATDRDRLRGTPLLTNYRRALEAVDRHRARLGRPDYRPFPDADQPYLDTELLGAAHG